MKKILGVVAVIAALTGSASARGTAGAVSVCGSDGSFSQLEVIGLTADQRLLCFSEGAPGQAREIGHVGGLMGGELLMDIDFRPADGALYGMGNEGGIYQIDAASGIAVRQSVLQLAHGRTPVPLEGTSFGIEFNPGCDCLHAISDAGENLRIDVESGATLVDPRLDPMSLAGGGAGGFDVFLAVSRANARARGLGTARVGDTSQLFAIDLGTSRTTTLGAFAGTDDVIGLAIPLLQGRNRGGDGMSATHGEGRRQRGLAGRGHEHGNRGICEDDDDDDERGNGGMREDDDDDDLRNGRMREDDDDDDLRNGRMREDDDDDDERGNRGLREDDDDDDDDDDDEDEDGDDD